MKEDKTLVCKECGKEFVFSASEQEFYESKGFNFMNPKASPTNRAAALPAVRLANSVLAL